MKPYRERSPKTPDAPDAPFDYGARIERGQKRVVRNALVIAGTLFGLARFLPKGIDPMIVVISLVASVMVGVLASIRIASGSATSAVDAFEEQMMERYRKRSHKKRR